MNENELLLTVNLFPISKDYGFNSAGEELKPCSWSTSDAIVSIENILFDSSEFNHYTKINHHQEKQLRSQEKLAHPEIMSQWSGSTTAFEENSFSSNAEIKAPYDSGFNPGELKTVRRKILMEQTSEPLTVRNPEDMQEENHFSRHFESQT
jgi:hypothetical protein